jgi:hypothetical protein
MSWKAALGAGLCFAYATVAPAARGAESLQIEWVAPDECPAETQFRERIADVYGRGNTASSTPLRGRVTLSRREDATWRAVVELWGTGAASTRSVEGDSCAGVAAAAEVIVGMALASARDQVATPPGDGADHEPNPQPVRPFLGAALLVDSGTLPSLAAGGEILAGVHAGRFRLEAEAAGFVSRDAVAAAHPTEGADFFALQAEARACYELGTSRVVLAPCAGGGSDWTHAHGFGSQAPRDADFFTAFLSAGGLAALRLGAHVWLRALAEGALPLLRPSYTIEGTGFVHRAAPLLVRGAVGAEVRF